MDIMLNDRLGLYGEVAHKVHAGDSKIVNGITNLDFGVLYRF